MKIVFDDFYKFLMSVGIVLFSASLFGILNILGFESGITLFILILLMIIGGISIIYAGVRWKKVQNDIDEKRKLKLIEARNTVQEKLVFPQIEDTQSFPEKQLQKMITKGESKIALVSYKVAHVLPSTVAFDFLKDWKVWFWIANHEPKRYRAYVKIKFISGNYEEDAKSEYYGGIRAWNLNAFSGIQAPGLGIPDKIKEAANQRKKIKVEINCTVKDENDELVEKKLTSVYAYDYEGKYWYLEP